jgi:hypothetical protein
MGQFTLSRRFSEDVLEPMADVYSSLRRTADGTVADLSPAAEHEIVFRGGAPGCASLAKVHINLASWNEADRCFLRGLEAEIDEPQVNAEYGLYLRDKGFLTKARFYLRRATEIDPVLSVARQALEDLDRT